MSLKKCHDTLDSIKKIDNEKYEKKVNELNIEIQQLKDNLIKKDVFLQFIFRMKIKRYKINIMK